MNDEETNDDCTCDPYDNDESCDWGEEPDYYFDGEIVDENY